MTSLAGTPPRRVRQPSSAGTASAVVWEWVKTTAWAPEKGSVATKP